MFAHQKCRICCVCTPTQMSVEQLFVCELWQERRNSFADADLGGIRIGICGMLRCGSRYRDALWFRCPKRLMLLEACESWKFVADFYDAVFVRLEEEAHVTVVDYGDVFVFCSFAGRELNVGIYPCLKTLMRNHVAKLKGHTFETHCSCRSTSTGLHAPAAKTTLSA